MNKQTFLRMRAQQNSNLEIYRLEKERIHKNMYNVIKYFDNKIIIDIPSGEKFQQLAYYYIGEEKDFSFNPSISLQSSRFKYIHKINEEWDNPFILFCYGGQIIEFSKKLKFLKNECIIVFGNSDENQTLEKCQPYIDCSKVLHIFCQNLSCYNDKSSFIPIGMANKQWPHGDIYNFLELDIGALHKQKTKDLFCSFKVSTNFVKRNECLIAINKKGITNVFYKEPRDYLKELSLHKYCICPEGNGLDSHRFWEALWVESIPITLRNPLTEQIQKLGIPCILLNNWDELDISTLQDYSSFVFDEEYFNKISFKYYSDKILSYVPKVSEKMNIVLSFIGKMPSYIIECVTQLRLFFKDSIYVIYNDISDEIKNKLNEHDVKLIEYETVISERFNNLQKNVKFNNVIGLTGREELNKRSYERFYLLEELMKKHKLENIWFMELDIIMYVDPNIFLPTLKNYPYCYCYHDNDKCNGSIFYIKNVESLQPILKTFDTHTRTDNMTEMYSLFIHLQNNKDDMLFPLIYSSDSNKYYWMYYGLFNGYIFDGAIIGQYFFGLDPYHSNGIINKQNIEDINKLYLFNNCVKIWNYIVEWIPDKNNLLFPYIREHPKGLLKPIVNMHIHSKDLISAVSYTSKINDNNIMQKYILSKYLQVCKTNPQPPGLADYLRGSLILLSLTLNNNYKFVVDHDCHPFFKCLERNDNFQAPQNIINLETKELIPPLESIEQKMLELFNSNENISVLTNSTSVQHITKEAITIFKDIFKPSIKIKNKLNEFIDKKINKDEKIIIFHFRLGDKFIHNNTQIDEKLFNKCINLMIEKIEEINIPKNNIILISDCMSLKTYAMAYIPDITITDFNPIHMGDLKNYNFTDVENTVFEFFLMSYASHIYNYNIYGSPSGFSKLINILYDIPFTYIN